MNSHLNIFKTYAKENRQHQLENDLTRALAISLQEDQLFLYSILKKAFENQESLYKNLFEDFTDKEKLKINIQQNVSSLEGFDYLIAISISEHKMITENFFNASYDKKYEPIPDINIQIDNVAIIFEIKPNGADCTSQLYNQALNALRTKTNKETLTEADPVIPIDLNWFNLMSLAVETLNFEKAIQEESRFLKDFIHYVSIHNHRWLPEAPLASLSARNSAKIKRRIETAINQSDMKPLNSRLGFEFELPWADEVLIKVTDDGFIIPHIYPGNTKGQGLYLFKKGKEPKFQDKVTVGGKTYSVNKIYHIKLTSFQKFFSGLWFTDHKLEHDLYSNSNFHNYTGRKVKSKGDWDKIERLFDEHFIDSYDWKKELKWNEKVRESGKSEFDISFGYELSFKIPFDIFQQFDKDKNDLNQLNSVLADINGAFKKILINK